MRITEERRTTKKSSNAQPEEEQPEPQYEVRYCIFSVSKLISYMFLYTEVVIGRTDSRPPKDGKKL